MDIQAILESRELFILDGSMGVLLQRSGLALGEHPEAFNLTHPEIVEKIHADYFAAGAQAVYTNTFGASRRKLMGSGYTVEEVIDAAVKIARRAAAPYEDDPKKGFVGLDIGPLGELLAPMGTLSFLEAYELFAQQVRQGVKSGVDFIVIETMTDLYEVKAAILAAKEQSSLPILCTMSFEENLRTFTGCDVRSFALTAEGLGVDAIGINCSLGPVEIYPIAKELVRWTTLPIVIKPNAGLPSIVDGETVFTITNEEFAAGMGRFLSLGVSVIGGCCGTDPACLGEMVAHCKSIPILPHGAKVPPAICSPSRVVVMDRVRVIGERINPTGKKKFKAALLEGDMDYILRQGISQAEAGADILDVNVGLPEIDEAAVMVEAVRALQGILDLPLQLDSSQTHVLEAALRAYNGKPIVNSVNGEEKVLDAILPLVKKYGAAVVGLTLDETGIPPTAEGRLGVARKILDRALSYGIRREDVYIDCLTLTVSAGQENGMETLKAVELVRRELGVETVLGVSNISFGLPAREGLNLMFLSQAMDRGLTLPILNPGDRAMMDAIAAYHALNGKDPACGGYIARFANREKPTDAPLSPTDRDIGYYIAKGLLEEAKAQCRALLEGNTPLEVVNLHLIPALDRVGADYELGKIFLPQLIQSAEAAKAAFEVIKSALAQTPGESVSRGKILIATVKGDIHDIGKNIVKVVLENYGYQLLDLGRDVPVERVVETAMREDVALIGLSALMTTTVKSMAETITALRASGHPCTIFVGGAVLTPEYAAQIGADYYAKDAQQAVGIARKVLGG